MSSKTDYGKGDRNRTKDLNTFRQNYEEIFGTKPINNIMLNDNQYYNAILNDPIGMCQNCGRLKSEHYTTTLICPTSV